MEHKLIMENWRKYVNEESLATKIVGTTAGMVKSRPEDISDIAKMFVDYLMEAFGSAAKGVANAAGRVDLLPGASRDALVRRAGDGIKNALVRANLLGKLKILLTNFNGAKLLLSKIGSMAVAKGLARFLPPAAIAMEIYSIISLWNRETKGVNTWGLALDAIKDSHAMAKDNPGHEEAVRYTTENFDKWDEETQVGWCVKHGDAPKDFDGRLTCQTVLQKADPKLIQKAKTAQGKGLAGKTDADALMSVPTS